MSADPRAVARIEQLYRKHGYIPDAPTGPIVTSFDPLVVANFIESEMGRVRRTEPGPWRLTLHMDIEDALKLARCLRRSVRR